MEVKNRSQLDILGSILESCIGGVSKSKVRATSNIPTNQFRTYLDYVVANGLLFIDNEGILRITSKGAEFLRRYYSLEELVNLNPSLNSETDDYIRTIRKLIFV